MTNAVKLDNRYSLESLGIWPAINVYLIRNDDYIGGAQLVSRNLKWSSRSIAYKVYR